MNRIKSYLSGGSVWIRVSFWGLNNSSVVDGVLLLAEHGYGRPDFVPVDVDVLTVRHVIFPMLVRKDRDFIRVVPWNNLAVSSSLVWNAALDSVLLAVIFQFELLVLPLLVTDSDWKALLLAVLGSQIVCTLGDGTLGDFIEHLKFVEELALVANEGLLFVELLA